MITIQTKSIFQVRIDYFDVYSHYYQQHDYKDTSATIYRKATLHTSHHTNACTMEKYRQQITSIFSNQP